MSEKKSTSMDEAYYSWVLLAQTYDAIFKARQKELDAYDISARQAAVLIAIKNIGDEATASKIARRQFREPHTVSEVLTRMEKQGLIKRARRSKKGENRITLTDKGKQACIDAQKLVSIHEVMSSLPEVDRQKLVSYLKILREKAFTFAMDCKMSLDVPSIDNMFEHDGT